MNDRFMFRAWDELNKIMHYDFQFIRDWSNGGWIIFQSDKQKLGWNASDKFTLNVYPNPYFAEQLKIQQSTGLKDKNGKLIYEGDVINDKSNHIRVVVWEQDSFKYPALKTSRYFHSPISNKLEERKVDLWGKLTFQDNISKRDKKHFEVIGNIYEDSHLIENSNNLC